MNAEEMQIKRAGWKLIIQSLMMRLGYSCDAFPTDRKTTIVVTDKRVPKWECTLEIIDGPRNLEIYFDGKFFSKSMNLVDYGFLGNKVHEHRYIHQQLTKFVVADEAKAAEWQQRQERELAKFKDIPWLTLTIIRDGPYAGRYHARFEPGHPFEFLTLEQVKALYKLCDRLNWKT